MYNQYIDDFIETSNGILHELSKNNENLEIYHYTSGDGLTGIVGGSKIRFSDRFALNDKSEGTYVIDLFINNINDIIGEKNVLFEYKKDIIDRAKNYKKNIKEERMKIYTVSFSKNGDSLPLWNYYTKGDTTDGFNLEFTSSKIVEDIKDRLNVYDNNQVPYVWGGSVIYDKKKQLDELKKFWDRFCEINKSFGGNDSKGLSRFLMHRLEKIFQRMTLLGTFFKTPFCEFEEEYRIAIDLCINDNNIETLKNEIKTRERSCGNKKFIIPYIELDFDIESISKICVSPTYTYGKARKCVIKAFEGKNCIPKVVRSKIPMRY